MKERPILFSAPMVRAILDGTKTQTRRVCKPAEAAGLSYVIGIQDPSDFGQRPLEVPGSGWFGDEEGDVQFSCPYGRPGDRLWVRETFMDLQGTGVEHRDQAGQRKRYAYGADTLPGSYGDQCRKDYGLKWRPSIHMPRAASRITLEITGVGVERLQNISEADAIAEGVDYDPEDCPFAGTRTAVDAYRSLWELINGPGSWGTNPWVWVVEFRSVSPSHPS